PTRMLGRAHPGGGARDRPGRILLYAVDRAGGRAGRTVRNAAIGTPPVAGVGGVPRRSCWNPRRRPTRSLLARRRDDDGVVPSLRILLRSVRVRTRPVPRPDAPPRPRRGRSAHDGDDPAERGRPVPGAQGVHVAG